jgi:hypothetical protein
MENHSHLLNREPHIGVKRLLLRFREPLAARLTLPALNLVLAVEPSLHHLDSAVVARQFGPCFLRAIASKMTVGLSNPAFGASPRLGPVSS